jgi:hypothetical protein
MALVSCRRRAAGFAVVFAVLVVVFAVVASQLLKGK